MKQIIIDTFFTKDKIVKKINNDIAFVDITSKENKSLVGNIYVGRVDKIINKNFAFINIGDIKNAFLDLSDVKENLCVDFDNDKRLKIKQGDKVVVQVLRDKNQEKGAMVTTQINYKSDNIVIFRALSPTVAVSKKIKETTRDELKVLGECLQGEISGGHFSILFRTSSKDIKSQNLENEYKELVKKAINLETMAKMQKPPMLLEKNDFFIDKILENLDVETNIITNDKVIFDDLKNFLVKQNLNNNIEFKDAVLIDYSIQKQIDKLFNKKIWLKSGGFLFIEQTEAAVIIDVNTGKNTKTKNRRKLIKTTNVEAIIEIAKQIKLRNLAGIIIIDLIDCRGKSDIEELKRIAYKSFKNDNVTIVEITSLGLLEITRKKKSESLSVNNKVDCLACNGEGKVFDYDYITNKILCDLIKQGGRAKVIIKANEKVIEFINYKYIDMFKELGEQISVEIELEKIQTGRLDYYEID